MSLVKKYRLHPGVVKSSDGDIHRISAPMLAKLWCVPMSECVVSLDGNRRDGLDLIDLHPREDGQYHG